MRHIFSVDRDVHTVEAGDEGGNHQDYGDRGHALHDGVHVVGNDGGECVHRTGELTGKAEPRAASSLLPSALADE